MEVKYSARSESWLSVMWSHCLTVLQLIMTRTNGNWQQEKHWMVFTRICNVELHLRSRFHMSCSLPMAVTWQFYRQAVPHGFISLSSRTAFEIMVFCYPQASQCRFYSESALLLFDFYSCVLLILVPPVTRYFKSMCIESEPHWHCRITCCVECV